jgi:hypothetical protein
VGSIDGDGAADCKTRGATDGCEGELSVFSDTIFGVTTTAGELTWEEIKVGCPSTSAVIFLLIRVNHFFEGI